MNKKQLLSIAMLLSVASMQAMTIEDFISDGAIVDAQVQTPTEVVAPGMLNQAWTAAKNGAAYAWVTAKVAPSSIYNAAKSGAFKTWETAKTVPSLVQNGASNVYTFAKANPTTFGVRAGAVAGAGYVAYRNAGKVWNKIKENPKTTAALVATGVLGYYKGDVALAAAKAAFAKLPATPESVTNAASTVASYVPATPEFVTNAAKVVANNPYTSAAYAAAGVQGVVDYVGLAGSQEEVQEDDEETATEIEVVTASNRNNDLFRLTGDEVTFKNDAESMSNGELRIKLQETINWCRDMNAHQYIPAIEAKLAELA